MVLMQWGSFRASSLTLSGADPSKSQQEERPAIQGLRKPRKIPRAEESMSSTSFALKAAAKHSQHQQLPGNRPDWLCTWLVFPAELSCPPPAPALALSWHTLPPSTGDVEKLFPPGPPHTATEKPPGWGERRRFAGGVRVEAQREFQYFSVALLPLGPDIGRWATF